jgi:apolipoprotein N-acyltransferase
MSAQQLAMSRLRAVEHDRAVVVSATTGISALVEPDGTVAQSTGLFTPASLVGRLPLKDTVTLADRLGPWTERALVAAAAAGVAAALWRGRARRQG